MTTNAKAGTQEFVSDEPPLSITEDRLGRAPFAAAIASAILRWRKGNGLVVALVGPWGSGKSTVKNFVVEQLSKARDSDPSAGIDVLQFNPWHAASGDLAEAFFREVGLAISVDDQGVKDTTVAKLWDAWAARLQAGAAVAKTLRESIVAGAVLVSSLSLSAIALTGESQPVIASISLASAGLAAFFEWGGNLAASIAKSIQTRGAATNTSAQTAKDRLVAALAKRTRPLLVILDDIDRLSTSETARLFQLLKVSNDLPNVLFFVLYQRELVESSLETEIGGGHVGRGRAYLEKIVQAPFTMPPIERTLLEAILFEGLNRIIADPTFDRHFDQHRWQNLFAGALRQFFQTLRDVRRYLNTLDVNAGIVRAPNTLEVNPIDFMGMEALRLFEPEVYEAIRQHPAVFTNAFRYDYESSAKAEDAATVDNILGLASPIRRDAIQELFLLLFPPTARVLRNTYYQDSGQWLRELRVCDESMFPRYFSLVTPPGSITQSDVDRLFAAGQSRQASVAEFRHLREAELLLPMLNHLEAYKTVVPPETVLPLSTALLDVGDGLPEDRAGFLELTPATQACRIIYFAVKEQRSQAARDRIWISMFQDTIGLSLPLELLSFLTPEKHATPTKRSEQRETADDEDGIAYAEDEAAASDGAYNPANVDTVIGDQALASIRENMLARVRNTASSDDLARNAHLKPILYRWSELSTSSEVHAFVNSMLESQEGTVAFITAVSTKVISHSAGDHVSRNSREFRLEGLDIIADLATLDEAVARLDRASVDADVAESIDAYARARKRGT